MKAIQITAPGKVESVSLPAPELTADQVLVKIGYVGFCGSDLNTYLGRNLMAISPVIPGHEIGGTVAAVGADVPDGLFSEGMSVTVNPYTRAASAPRAERGGPTPASITRPSVYSATAQCATTSPCPGRR